MRFNPAALVVCLAFFALLTFALTKGSAAVHAGEAIVTVLILLSIGGLAFRGGQRSQ